MVKLYLGLPTTNPSGRQPGILNLGFSQASLVSWQLGHAVSVLANNKMLILSRQPRVSLAKFTSTTRNRSFWRVLHLYQWAVVLSRFRISCYQLTLCQRAEFQNNKLSWMSYYDDWFNKRNPFVARDEVRKSQLFSPCNDTLKVASSTSWYFPFRTIFA